MAITLMAWRAPAQPQPLVMNTLAGSANFGSADGIAPAAKFYYPSSVALDGSGNLYVADLLNSTIRRVSPSGIVSTLAGSAQKTGTNDGLGSGALFNFPSGVAVDSNCVVYVADSYNNTIRQIATNGAVSTVAGLSALPPSFRDGPATADTNFGATFARPFGVAADGAGNIYVADTYNNLIRKISGGNVTTLAGKLSAGASDGAGTNASFNLPYALATDGAGNIYVADFGNNLIRRITPGGAVTTIAGAGGAVFSAPSGIAVDSLTNIYVADTTNQVIRKLSPSGTNWIVSTVAGKPGVSGDSDGTLASASFFNPWGVAVDGASNIYVGDSFNGNIRKISAGTVTTLAGPDASYGLVNGPGPQARFNQPWGVAVDGACNIFVADYFNNCIRRISAAGNVSIIAGSTNGAIGSADGVNNNARFYYPAGICLDAATNLYVADSYNSTIRKIIFDGTNWTTGTLAGQAGVYNYQDGAGTNAWFFVPAGVTVDSATNIYVADSFNNAIRVIAPNGTVTTLAGNGNLLNGGDVDANGTNALFNYPVGVAVDSFMDVYVADAVNNSIRLIFPGGDVSTVTNFTGLNFPEGVAVDAIGNVYVANSSGETLLGRTAGGKLRPINIAGTNSIVGSADGLNTAAQFDSPIGLAIDAAGAVYVADTANNTIRKGVPLTTGSSVLALNSSPSGFPIAANGVNFSTTPQFLVLTTGSSNSVSAPTPAGYVFVDWTQDGTVVGTAADYAFVIGSNTTLVANYLPFYSVTLSASPVAGGAVGGAKSFPAGSTVLVTATPANGYIFSNWTLNGAVVSTSTNYTFVLNANVALVANFAPVFTVGLSAAPANGGTVSGAGTFLAGSTNTVTATPNSGFIFGNWTSNGVVVSASTNYLFTLNANVALVGNFLAVAAITASASPANGGSVSGAGTFLTGTTTTVTATPSNGFVFVNWTQGGAVVSTSNIYTFILNSNVTLTAGFAPVFTIAAAASPTNGGTVGGGGTFLGGSTNTVIAAASGGYLFTGWTLNGNVVSTTPNYSFVLNSNVTLVANFVQLYVLALSASPTNGGTFSGGGLFAAGSTNTVTATAANGYAFTNWTLNGVLTSTNVNYSFVLGSNVSLVANFVLLPVASAPFATTLPASGITGAGAVLNGAITANLSASSAWFQWGVNTNYGNQTPATNGIGGAAPVFLHVPLAGLAAGQPYHFRLVASNSVGTAVGADQVFAVGGKIWGWGYDGSGQIDIPANATNIVAVAGGGSHSLALKKDGSIEGWGDDYYGQIDPPVSASNSATIAAGYDDSLALAVNGTVSAWGEDTFGQTTVPASLAGCVAVAAGDSHCLALQGTGLVAAWGADDAGQIDVPASLSNVVAIAAGGSHNLALKNDGTVVAWGKNAAPSPVSNVVAIAAGLYHSVALQSNGTVVAWGDNTYGQTAVPAGATNVIAIAAGRLHTLALRGDGTLIAWGDNSVGQTNIPPGLINITAMASGAYHNLAVGIITPPLIVTLPATSITATNAVLQGSVTANTLPVTVWFQWGRTTNYVNITSNLNFDGGTATMSFSNRITGLAPLSVYHYRAVASNETGAFFGGDAVFSTPVAPFSIVGSGFTVSNNFHLRFNGTPNASYTLWASTNLSNWLQIGSAVEDLPGVYEANDPAAANYSARFYELRWP